MICIVGDRRSGKTTALIKMSAETGIPIFAPNRKMADCIEKQASDMGLRIPKPATYDERRVHGYRHVVMIDEVQMLLKQYLDIDVVCATFDKSGVDLSSVTLFELLGMWWRARRANDADGKAPLSS